MLARPLGKTGERVSVLGFGAGPLGNEYGPIDEAEGARAVRAAIDRGISFFDTAPYYGRTLSEERLGRALAGRRDEVFLATKCCRYDYRGFDFSAEHVRTSIDESLARLRTDRVDLFQVHDVEFGEHERILEETLPAMQAVKESGKARFIGVTGLPLAMLRGLAEAFPIDTVLSYCHGNLLASDLVKVLGPLVAERGIGLINASPLHMGILSPEGAPAWHPAPEEVKAAGRRVVELCRAGGRDVVRVALRFALDLAPVTTTLVGMKTVAQVEGNVAVLEEAADPELLTEIAEIVAPVRDRTWHDGLAENAP